MMGTTKMVLETLKCVICQEISNDSLQCYNGHAHCKPCLKQYQHSLRMGTKCTVCRSRKAWASTRTMVQVASSLHAKVVCGVDGCQEEFGIDEINQHRQTCKHKLFQCPVVSSSSAG